MCEPGGLTVTIEEASVLLGIGRNLTYELAARDELPVPVIRLGRRILVPREPLLEALGVLEIDLEDV